MAGFLARRLDEAEVVAVVRAAATVADDDEVADREQAVRTTVRRLQVGESVTGSPAIERLAPDLSNALASWWGAPPEPAGLALPDRPSPRKAQADELVELGRTAELFHDATGAAFARLRVGDHREIWPLYSKRFKAWLRRGFFVDQDKVPGTDAVNAALGVLEGIACIDGPEHELHNRVARLDDAIYYDLADDAWRCVRISSSGWENVNDPPILFRRYAHQRPQVEPAVGGDVRAILRFLNLDPSDHLLLLALLVGTFVPDIPPPIPDFHGEKGSGKSVGQRVWRRLIDPSSVETLTFPTDVRELVQQLSHHYAPVSTTTSISSRSDSPMRSAGR